MTDRAARYLLPFQSLSLRVGKVSIAAVAVFRFVELDA